MTYEDTVQFMKDLGYFHAACWGEPVSNDAGLGPFRAHWQNLNDDYWEDGETTWVKAVPKWEDVYGESLLSMVSEEVGETIKKLVDIYASKNGKKIQEELLKELQKRPRTITHGDARGNNIFKSKNDGSMGIIDWQMWVAGPASNEFGQVWFNSFSLESGMIHRFEELTKTYYESLCSHKPEIREEYPFDQMMIDIKLLFINIILLFYSNISHCQDHFEGKKRNDLGFKYKSRVLKTSFKKIDSFKFKFSLIDTNSISGVIIPFLA